MNNVEFWLMNNPVRSASLRLEAKKLRKMSPEYPLDHVLEIGCGQGQGTKNILRYCKPKSFDAIDLDPRMIKRAKRRLADRRVSFMVGDAADLSFAKSNTYDAIFDFGIIHHIPNWPDCLKELHRVLKPGGYVYLEDLSIESFTKPPFGKLFKRVLKHPYDAMYRRHTFDKELGRLGFKVINTYNAGPLLFYTFWRVLKK